MSEKQCTTCKTLKSSSEFHHNRRTKDGLMWSCKSCRVRYNATHKPLRLESRKKRVRLNPDAYRLQQREWRARNADRNRECHRRNRLRRNFGITSEQFTILSETQNHCCAICRVAASTLRDKILHVDHDHLTGKIRGLLCGNCNRAIGLMKDSSANLRSSADYLEARR